MYTYEDPHLHAAAASTVTDSNMLGNDLWAGEDEHTMATFAGGGRVVKEDKKGFALWSANQ